MPPAARSEVPLVAMSERGPCLLTERGVYLVKGLVTLPVGITCAIGFCFFILGCYLAVYPPIAVDRKEFLSCGIIISLIGLIYTLVPLQANYAFVTGGSTFGSGWTGKGVTSMFLLCNGAAVLCFIVIASLLALALNHFADVRDDDDAPYSPVETYVRDRFNNFFFYASKHCSEETLDWLWHWIGTYCPEGLHLNRCINCGYGVPFCRAHEQTCYAEDSIGRACPYSICRENFADYVVTAISAPFYGAVALYMSANIIMCTVFTIMHFTVLHDTAEASEHREKPACETDEFMIRDDKEYFIHVQPYEPNADDDGSTTVQLTTCSHDEADVATARKLKKAVVMDSVGKVLKTTILQYDPVTCTYDYLEPSDRSIVRGLERAHSVDSNESRISSTSSITVDDLLRRQAKGRIDLTNRALPPLPHHDASYSTSGLSMSRISGDESCSFNKESSDIINDDEEQCLRGSIEAGKSSPRMLELPPSRAPVSSCTTTPSGGSIGNMSQCGSYRSQRQMSSGSVVIAAAGAGLRTSARLTVMDRQHSGRRRTGDDGESETDRMVFNFEDIPQHSNRSSCGFDSAKTSPVSGTPGSSPRSSMNKTTRYIVEQIEPECGRSDSAESKQQQQNEV